MLNGNYALGTGPSYLWLYRFEDWRIHQGDLALTNKKDIHIIFQYVGS